jgi:hypothetical protein
MARPRPVKRLALRYDYSRPRENSAAIEAEVEHWRQRGIRDVNEIIAAFDVAEQLRVRFEDELQGPRYLSPEGRRVKRAFLEVIEIVHAEGVSEVEASLRSLVKKYFLDTTPEHPPKRPRGQPEETWLRGLAFLLFALWREAGQSWDTTVKDVARAFALAGHGDVVTEASVRYLARGATQEELSRMLAKARAALAGRLDRR